MRKCEKCGTENGVREWRIAGGFYALLCLHCANDATENNALAIMELRIHEAATEVFIRGGRLSEALKSARCAVNDRAGLFARSKAWVGQGRAGDEKATV